MSGDDETDGETQGERLIREDQDALFSALAGVMEERDLDEQDLVPMLVEAIYYYRSVAYVAGTAKPSEAGMRMDLDRLRKMIDEVQRDYRKNAAAVIRDVVSMLDATATVVEGEEISGGSGH
ncbi:MAG: hypothetical protein KDK07_00745 [Bauldia sp.]|nr:hypothetical protein [Bauldia sp.]